LHQELLPFLNEIVGLFLALVINENLSQSANQFIVKKERFNT